MSGPSGTTTDTNATIVFDVNNLQPTQELSAPTVTCTLDSGAPLLCDSPARYSGLTVGDHQVVIRATGSTGSVGSARVAWKIVPSNGQALRASAAGRTAVGAAVPQGGAAEDPEGGASQAPRLPHPRCRQRGDPKRLVRAGRGCAAHHGLPDNREHARRVRGARDRVGARAELHPSPAASRSDRSRGRASGYRPCPDPVKVAVCGDRGSPPS